MSNEFLFNLVAYGDQPGLGLYSIGHYRQHLNYRLALAKQGMIIQDVPIIDMIGHNPEEFEAWLQIHEGLHQQLRGITRSFGFSLASFDVRSPQAFLNWQQDHRAEHGEFDKRLGL
jgi:hypothetical protein